MNETVSVKIVPTSISSHSAGVPYVLVNTVAQRSSFVQQATPTEPSRTIANDDIQPETSHIFAYSFITLGAMAFVAVVVLMMVALIHVRPYIQGIMISVLHLQEKQGIVGDYEKLATVSVYSFLWLDRIRHHLMPMYTFDPADDEARWEADLLEDDREQQIALSTAIADGRPKLKFHSHGVEA